MDSVTYARRFDKVTGSAIRELSVDSRLSLCNMAVEAGANVLVAGSAVYGAEDIPAAIQALRVSGGAR